MLNVFALVANTVSMIRLGNSDGSDVRSYLTDELFVDTAYVYVRKRRAFKLDTCGCYEFYGVGITYVEGELVALNGCFPTYTFYFKRFYETARYTRNHTVYKRSVKTVFCVGVRRIVQSFEHEVRAFRFDRNVAYDFARQSTLRSLYGYDAVFKIYRYACGKRDGHFTDSRHCPLPPYYQM